MEDRIKSPGAKIFLVPAVIMIGLGLVLFLPAGSFRYWEAWVYWSGFSALTWFITAYFFEKDPGFLSRRTQFKEKEPPPVAIRILSSLSMLSYLIPGFDYRYHWSAVPVWMVITANAVVLAGYVFIFFVFRENRYAATIIQVEKEQQVIATGPYAVVRHPMYTGLLLMQLFIPLALGSYWALILAVLFIPANLFRIEKEEKVLLRDLPGYADYCLKTPYRLLPSIW